MNFAGRWIRSNVLPLMACAGLLAAFAGISWCSWLNKSAAFDEPLHFVGAWMQTHYGDFRCNPEDPPLWKYYVALGTDPRDMKPDRQSDLWNRMLVSIPAPAVRFVAQTMYQTFRHRCRQASAGRAGTDAGVGGGAGGGDRLVGMAARRSGGRGRRRRRVQPRSKLSGACRR